MGTGSSGHRVIPTWHQRPKVLRYTSYREDRMGGRSWEMTQKTAWKGRSESHRGEADLQLISIMTI